MSTWNTNECQALLADLEQSPRRVQLHHPDRESVIACCMDKIFELAKSGEDQERKMELAALEYRPCGVCSRWSV